MMCRPEEINKALATGKNAILMHSNADMDCVGSAAALSFHYGIECVMAPGGISHLGKKLLSALNLEARPNLETDGIDQFIVVDAQDDSSLGYSGTPWDRAIVIDHHRKKETMNAALAIVDENSSSCCEIIWEIIDRPKKISREMGMCLMAGIVADTGHFRRGGVSAFRCASEILEAAGLSMDDILLLFESAEDQDMSRRISRLKGAQRMKYDRVGEWLVAVTEIGAFEAAAAHALLSVGADVAFAGSQKEEGFRITGRANQSAVGTGVHLGELFHRIAGECGGEGGGHDGAAGFTGNGDVESMLDICSQNAIITLKGKKKNEKTNEENVL
ncbi:MAG: DHH family phosphoesterase [Candidatus Thermoplasmatota archaeon]|nr:hypothetical protein [Euryarchaeota archaeon]MBU4031538.1 DHH family phosphoesterase [Candidatus Thermoplasmatota archaeon]MBU4072168.1 DHH family phosphoesterase [Candidatus Thermoplasmatota archaeon]MBU4144079.1 DHH family phosphoesterase [Candidatus Thermoplasmatota archaeon]MBU4592249.1 DHH family phosphoesterase [Candidatus Thermoplasmatota archaeon]